MTDTALARGTDFSTAERTCHEFISSGLPFVYTCTEHAIIKAHVLYFYDFAERRYQDYKRVISTHAAETAPARHDAHLGVQRELGTVAYTSHTDVKPQTVVKRRAIVFERPQNLLGLLFRDVVW